MRNLADVMIGEAELLGSFRGTRQFPMSATLQGNFPSLPRAVVHEGHIPEESYNPGGNACIQSTGNPLYAGRNCQHPCIRVCSEGRVWLGGLCKQRVLFG